MRINDLRGSRSAPRVMQVIAAGVVGFCSVSAHAQASATDASRTLEGRWRVELTIDVTDARHVPTSRDAKGEIAFDSTSWWNPGDRWGRHSLDLGAFFGRTGALPKGVAPFSATDTSLVTEVTGRMRGPMATVEFMPRSARYGITLEGRLVGDSIVGQWARRGMDGSGTFVMHRLSREPVRVAAINDPMLNPSLRVAAAAAPATAARSGAAKPGPAARTTASTAGAAARVAAATTTTAATPAVSAPRPPASTQAATGRPANMPATSTASAASPTTQAASAPITTSVTTVPAPATSAAGSGATPGYSGTGSTATTGNLRVRILDTSSRRWFSTTYQLQLSDGKWLWGDMKTGSGGEGWGAATARPVGTHQVVIANFLCGDKYWFLAQPLARPVEIRPGETAELTIEADVKALPAKKSYDNPKAASCALPPGDVP